MIKIIKQISTFVVLLALGLLISCSTAKNTGYPVYKAQVTTLEPEIFSTKFGNLNTTADSAEFFSEGKIEWGDIVEVRFLDKCLSLPVVPLYSYVDSGTPAVIVPKNEDGQPTGVVQLAINMGDFTTTYGIATKTINPDTSWFWTANEGVELPMDITFQVSEKAGYMSQYLVSDLTRTNERNDYPHLTDEEFANFRKVNTSGISKLYRTSSPICAELGRNTYADKALRDAGVTVIINISDDRVTAESRPEFKDTYYSTCNIKYLNLSLDITSDQFKKGLAEGLKFFAANKGIYAEHCIEGKAGFISALLECLMGASAQEVADDYMKSYTNYYGVEKGTEKYNAILESNIVKTIEEAFGIEDFYADSLSAGAENYIKSIGLSDAEIISLKNNLR